MTALNNQNLLQLRFINQANIDLVKPSFDNLPAIHMQMANFVSVVIQ